jgi:glycosyltransferase involved in cell wall biosynthesis
MPSKRIVIFSSHFKPHWGGIERFTDIQSRILVSLGWEVKVVTHDTERLGFFEHHEGLDIYRLSCLTFMKGARFPFPSSIFELRRVYIECFSPSPAIVIVHARYYLLSLIGCLFARLSGAKLILIDHSSNYITLKSRAATIAAKVYEQLMTRCMMLFRPRVYGVAQACVEWLKTFSIQASGVYYNGLEFAGMREAEIDIHQLHGLTKDTRIILSVGRLVQEKGVAELVRAFRSFSESNAGYALVIIGYGELEGVISRAAESHRELIFVGRQSPEIVWGYMRQADIFVNPSNYPEGMPTILLEAGYYGLRVLSTLNGGAAEIIRHGETGVSISRGGYDEILSALEFVHTHFEKTGEWAKALRAVIETRFSFERMTREFLAENEMGNV